MFIITHILASTALIKLLHLSTVYEIVLAIIFGVLIDADELIKLPRYLKWNYAKKRFKFLAPFYRRTPLQEPVSLLWIIPVAIYFSTPVPVIFFAVHVAMDYLKYYEKRPFYPFIDVTIPVRKISRWEYAIEALILASSIWYIVGVW